MQNPDTHPPQFAVADPEGDLRQGLKALQDSLLVLARSLEGDAQHSVPLAQAFEALAEVDQDSSALCEYAFPSSIELQEHDLHSLVLHAWQDLPDDCQAKVLLDLEHAQVPVLVDSELFQKRITQLLAEGLNGQVKTVFVHVLPVERSLHLNLIWSESPEGALDFQNSLVFQTALRDLHRMGVDAGLQGSGDLRNCLVLHVPTTVNPGGLS